MIVTYKPISPDNYHVLHPRPVYLIVSRGNGGKPNVMAASWVTPVNDEPFLVAVSVWKGSLTHHYIASTREFTVNIPSEKHVNVVYGAGTTSGREVDKVSAFGLRLIKSSRIEAPGLENMLGFVECRVVNEVDLGESTLFIAKVEAIHVVEGLYTRYGWDVNKAKILLHNVGRGFTVPGRLILAEK